MRNRKFGTFAMVLATVLFFGSSLLITSNAWARFGGGRSFGSFGGRSYSRSYNHTYSSPYRSGSNYNTYGSSRSRMGGLTRHPFFQGLAGGLAGGFLGNLLFGHTGYAYPGGMMGGGGFGLLDLIIIGLIIYLVIRFLRRRSGQGAYNTGYYADAEPYDQPMDSYYGTPQLERYDRPELSQPSGTTGDVQMGLQQIRQFDPSFNEEAFKETVEDIFFRVQAAWMNRQVDGVEPLVTREMVGYMEKEFAAMKQQRRINRLENIAVRKVELIDVWQETGKDYITVLYTANLLDYTVDEKTGAVVEGDKLNPVKFQEYWTFCRDIGSHQWQLSGFRQV